MFVHRFHRLGLAGWLAVLATGFMAVPSRADVAVPIGTAVSQIESANELPILLPSSVPMDEVYLDVEARGDRYYVGFDYRPDCHSATACNFGEIMAEPDDGSNPPDTAETVRLADGTPAAFYSSCGAHCQASVQWLYNGTVYRVMVKNGDREGTMALANSAILGGDRRSQSSSQQGDWRSGSSSSTSSSPRPTTRATSSSSSGSTIGSTVRLFASDPSSPINIRSGAGTSNEVLHFGYAGDTVEVVNRVSGADGYEWFNIRFPQSGAMGWVRGDFIAR
jgi:hypothetical protein